MGHYYTAFELRSELEDEAVNEDAEVIFVDMHGVYMQPAHIIIIDGQPIVVCEMIGSYNYPAQLREDISDTLRQLREVYKGAKPIGSQQRFL